MTGSPGADPADLRDYQDEAVRRTATALRKGGRGQVRAACGTGKTLIALQAAEKLVPGSGLVIFLAPSLGLVAQTLAAWERDAAVSFTSRAVCSDETVTGYPAGSFDDVVSTDPDIIAGWVGGSGRKVIVGTYASAAALGSALQAAGRRAHLLVCDEAHRLAGAAGKAVSGVLDDSVLPASRRLFLTATPRLCWSDKSPGLSMDDEGLFGPVLYEYPFARAIADGWLDDYQVAVIGISDAEIIALLDGEPGREYADGDTGLALTTVAAQVALARAAREYGIRRAVTFHSRVLGAGEFALTLPSTIRRMPDDTRPAQPVHARHVHGGMNARERGRILDSLREPPDDGWSVVANARCLTEGIDVPAIDAVLFASPRDSVVDVAQAVGRALRRNADGPGKATIIIPVIIPAGGGPDLDSGAFETVWRVVRAMRAHDETLAQDLDFARSHWARGAGRHRDGESAGLPGKITISIPGAMADRLIADLSLAIIQHAASQWWDGYAHAQAFRAASGHLLVPNEHVTASGFHLGHWVGHARQDHAKGRLPADRAAALEKLGMAWDAREAKWETLYAAAAAYATANGHLRIPQDYETPDGLRLGWWIKTQRYRRARGLLSAERTERLDAIGMACENRTGRHARTMRLVREFHAEHGHIDIPQRHVTGGGFLLGHWLGSRRAEYHAGTIHPELAAELEQLGVRWRVRKSPLKKAA